MIDRVADMNDVKINTKYWLCLSFLFMSFAVMRRKWMKISPY